MFLTACQLATTDFFGNKEKNLAMTLRKNVKKSNCKAPDEECRGKSHNCCGVCMIRKLPKKPICTP
uniref:Conotoxin superfamily O1 n=1 Tax=Conus ermineus TaxID=55423 RepID=A0A346CIW1_CONER|nr:conotoxin precursor superfamily O1 [Conus ermineus]